MDAGLLAEAGGLAGMLDGVLAGPLVGAVAGSEAGWLLGQVVDSRRIAGSTWRSMNWRSSRSADACRLRA